MSSGSFTGMCESLLSSVRIPSPRSATKSWYNDVIIEKLLKIMLNACQYGETLFGSNREGGQVAFTFIIFSQFMCRRMHQWCDQNIYTLVPTTSKRNGLLIGHSWQLHVGADHFTGGPHMQRQSTT